MTKRNKQKRAERKEAQRANQFPRVKENENERRAEVGAVGKAEAVKKSNVSVPKPDAKRKRKISFKRTKQNV